MTKTYAHRITTYGIFPKEQCAKMAVALEVFERLKGQLDHHLTSSYQPGAVLQAVEAARKTFIPSNPV